MKKNTTVKTHSNSNRKSLKQRRNRYISITTGGIQLVINRPSSCNDSVMHVFSTCELNANPHI